MRTLNETRPAFPASYCAFQTDGVESLQARALPFCRSASHKGKFPTHERTAATKAFISSFRTKLTHGLHLKDKLINNHQIQFM